METCQVQRCLWSHLPSACAPEYFHFGADGCVWRGWKWTWAREREQGARVFGIIKWCFGAGRMWTWERERKFSTLSNDYDWSGSISHGSIHAFHSISTTHPFPLRSDDGHTTSRGSRSLLPIKPHKRLWWYEFVLRVLLWILNKSRKQFQYKYVKLQNVYMVFLLQQLYFFFSSCGTH